MAKSNSNDKSLQKKKKRSEFMIDFTYSNSMPLLQDEPKLLKLELDDSRLYNYAGYSIEKMQKFQYLDNLFVTGDLDLVSFNKYQTSKQLKQFINQINQQEEEQTNNIDNNSVENHKN